MPHFFGRAAASLGDARPFPRLLLFTLLAAALRLILLGEHSFWLDEVGSLALSRMTPAAYFQQVLAGEGNFSTYYMLFLKPWLALGDGEFVARLGSVLWALATVPLIYALGCELFGRSVGFYSTLLFSLSTYQIRYAQWARGYTLLMFLAVLATLLLVRAVRRPAPGVWAGYVGVSVLMVYTHFLSALLLPAHAASVLLLPRRQVPWKHAMLSALAASILLLPAVYYLTHFNQGQLSFLTVPDGYRVYRLLVEMAGGRLLLPVFAALMITALWAVRRRRDPASAWPVALSLTVFILPVGISFAVSQFEPIFEERYLVYAHLGWILLAAAGLNAIRGKYTKVVVTTALVLLMLGSVFQYHRKYRLIQDWRGATAHVLDGWRQGDALVFYYGLGRLPFEYYADRQAAGLTDRATIFPAGWGLAFPAHNSVPQIPDAALFNGPARPPRVWVIAFLDKDLGRDRVALDLQRDIAKSYQRGTSQTFTGDIRVALYHLKPPAAAP